MADCGLALEPQVVSGDDPLVQTLLLTFSELTGIPGLETDFGGGTYGRNLQRGVAFGATMPGQENDLQLDNEYMPIQDIVAAVAIVADDISRLVK